MNTVLVLWLLAGRNYVMVLSTTRFTREEDCLVAARKYEGPQSMFMPYPVKHASCVPEIRLELK